jgi:signal transduction histidine kinase
MSHEIRTPINGVVGMVEILETSKLTIEQSRIVETIRDSSTALLSKSRISLICLESKQASWH